MTMPLVVLAILSLIGGYFTVPELLSPLYGHAHPHVSPLVKYLPTLLGLGGIGLAYRLYVQDPATTDRLSRQFAGLHQLLLNKYYVDELYEAAIVRPLLAASDWLWKVWDTVVIDGLVNGTAQVIQANGSVLRFWQTGNVQTYALSFCCGAIVILGYYLW